jgi:hypothetical protein
MKESYVFDSYLDIFLTLKCIHSCKDTSSAQLLSPFNIFLQRIREKELVYVTFFLNQILLIRCISYTKISIIPL